MLNKFKVFIFLIFLSYIQTGLASTKSSSELAHSSTKAKTDESIIQELNEPLILSKGERQGARALLTTFERNTLFLILSYLNTKAKKDCALKLHDSAFSLSALSQNVFAWAHLGGLITVHNLNKNAQYPKISFHFPASRAITGIIQLPNNL